LRYGSEVYVDSAVIESFVEFFFPGEEESEKKKSSALDYSGAFESEDSAPTLPPSSIRADVRKSAATSVKGLVKAVDEFATSLGSFLGDSDAPRPRGRPPKSKFWIPSAQSWVASDALTSMVTQIVTPLKDALHSVEDHLKASPSKIGWVKGDGGMTFAEAWPFMTVDGGRRREEGREVDLLLAAALREMRVFLRRIMNYRTEEEGAIGDRFDLTPLLFPLDDLDGMPRLKALRNRVFEMPALLELERLTEGGTKRPNHEGIVYDTDTRWSRSV
jgi:hypothetical protein